MSAFGLKYAWDLGVSWVFGYVIAWWFWAAVGLAVAVALFLLLPAGVPSRLRTLLAFLAFSAGAIISAGSWGIDRGRHTERAVWELKVAAEKQRLRDEAQKEKRLETERANAAELFTADLQERIRVLTASPSPPSTADGPVVSESFARGLREWKGRRNR